MPKANTSEYETGREKHMKSAKGFAWLLTGPPCEHDRIKGMASN